MLSASLIMVVRFNDGMFVCVPLLVIQRRQPQVEERLRFYEEGVAPRKNASVMGEAMDVVKTQLASEDKEEAVEKKKKDKVC